MKQQYMSRAKEILEWFDYHNKNLTKQQWYYIEELKTIIINFMNKGV